MINEILKIKIQTTFNLTDRQMDSLDKFDPAIVEKAFNKTQTWKPGNRIYFKDALKYYSSPSEIGKKYPEPEIEKSTISAEFLKKHREEIKNRFS